MRAIFRACVLIGLTVAVCLQLQASAPPPPGGSDVSFVSPDRVARIPIEIRDAHIFFRGTLDDSLVWLTLDTGAYTHVVDDAFARGTGKTLVGEQRLFGAAGSTASARGRGLTIGLPGVRLESQSFTTTPLRFLEGSSGLHVKAILGYEVFSRFVVEVDYAGREMRLHDPERYRYRGRGASIPITLRENHPYVRGQIEMPGDVVADGEFVIDTGSGSSLMLDAQFAAGHDLPQRLDRKQEGRGQAVGGELRTVAGRLPGMRLGPFRVDGPITMFPNAEITAPGAAGNIGGRLLGRFRVIFDYARMRMILEPNARFHEREESDMGGVALLASGPDLDTVRVLRVRPGSPGDEAGVKPGDALERIDGRSASEIGLDSLRAMFRVERSYEVVLRRDDRAVPLTIRTRRSL